MVKPAAVDESYDIVMRGGGTCGRILRVASARVGFESAMKGGGKTAWKR